MTTKSVVPAENDVSRLPELHEIFSSWNIKGMSSWNDVGHLGRNNIGYLLSLVRGNEKNITSRIHELKERVKMFENKDGLHFRDLAEKYENPEIKTKGEHPNGGWCKEVEPIGIQHEQRKSSATNYNICGWCKHASGTHRFQYCISGSCRLLSEQSDEKGEVQFDTPCVLHGITADESAVIVENINNTIDKSLAKRETIREAIRKLIELRDNADGDKPWLVGFRPHDYMNVGDELAVYIGNLEDKKVEGSWVDAIGVFAYRHHDGCMSYQTIFPIHDNMSYYEGRGGGGGRGRPEVLLRSEFDYLHNIAEKFSGLARVTLDAKLKNADSDIIFLSIWFGNIEGRLKGFNPTDFFQDLRVPEFVQSPQNWKSPDDEIIVRTVKDAEWVLSMLDASLFKTAKEIKSWANMQLRYVHPDKLNGVTDSVREYAERQTRAVFDARDFLIERLR